MTQRTIEILGTGCAKCRALEASARQAIAQAGIDAVITKVERIEDIVARGVMITPALAIDGQIKASGRALSADEIRAML